MSKEILIIYRCDQCEWEYADLHSSIECCAPEPTEVYECGICGSESLDRLEAEKCCEQDDDDDDDHPKIDPKELEAAGQYRLFQ